MYYGSLIAQNQVSKKAGSFPAFFIERKWCVITLPR